MRCVCFFQVGVLDLERDSLGPCSGSGGGAGAALELEAGLDFSLRLLRSSRLVLLCRLLLLQVHKHRYYTTNTNQCDEAMQRTSHV